MWENETKKTWIRNIVIFIVLVIVAGALLVTMLLVKKQIVGSGSRCPTGG